MYWRWVYYGAGTFVGFFNAINYPQGEPTLLHGAVTAIAATAILCLLTWIISGLKP